MNPSTQSSPDLLTLLKQPLENLVQQDIRADVDPEKVIQLSNAKRNVLYFAGKQYLYPVMTNGNITDWSTSPSTGNMVGSSSQTTEGTRCYDRSVNIEAGLGEKYIAVLGQRAPNMKARPDRAQDDGAAQRVQTVDIITALLRQHWNVDQIQQLLGYYFWTTSTAFFYTPYVANGNLYGTTTEPEIELREIPVSAPYFECPNCGFQNSVQDAQSLGECAQCNHQLGPQDFREGQTATVPEVTGQIVYPNGSVELHLTNCFTTTTQFYIHNLAEGDYLWYEYNQHKGALMNAYGDIQIPDGSGGEFTTVRKMLQNRDSTGSGGSTSSNTASTARDMISSPSKITMPRKNRALYTRFWLRPSMYELLGGDDSGQKREQCLQAYPDGLKITMIDGQIIQLEAERMDEVWAAAKPSTTEYLYPPAVCEYLHGIQDLYNDAHNMMAQALERSIPATVYDPQVFDIAVLKSHAGLPAEFIPAKLGRGQDINSSMWNTPVSKPDPGLTAWPDALKAVGGEIVGVTPPIFGATESNDETAHGLQIKTNQALMQLSVPWNNQRGGWAQAFENGVVQFAKYGNGKFWSKRGTSALPPQMVEIEGLDEVLKGGWHLEPEEAMPMTWGQRRDVWWDLTAKSPETQQMLGVQDPENLAVAAEILGMPDWKVPNLDALRYIHAQIDLLASQSPTPGPPGPDGSPGPPQSSVPPDDFLDPTFVVKVVAEWLVSSKGRQLQKSNPDGYENVKAYWQAYNGKANTPPPPPPIKATVNYSVKAETEPPETTDAVMQQAGLTPPGFQPPPPPPPGPPPPGGGGSPAPPGPPGPPPGLTAPPLAGMQPPSAPPPPQAALSNPPAGLPVQ